MRVQVIRESTGFGYSQKIIDWITEADENLGKLEKLKKGEIVEIPERITRGIYNLVDVETGLVVSRRTFTELSPEEIKRIYAKPSMAPQSKTRKIIKETLGIETSDDTKVESEVATTKLKLKPKKEKETE
jgi:hypothetical protein